MDHMEQFVFIMGPSGSDAYMSLLTTTDGGTLTQGLTQDHLGAIGIGTTAPVRELHIKGPDNATIRLESIANADATDIEFYYGSSRMATIGSSGSSGIMSIYTDTTLSNGFRIGTDSTERLRIDFTGNVGIGNNDPQFKLQVAGSVALDVMPTHESEGIIRIGRYDANTTRYNDIKSYVSSTAASNYLKFSLHNGTASTVVDVLTLNGNQNATFAGDLTVKGDTITLYDGSGASVGALTVLGTNNLTISGTQTDHCGLSFATNAILPATEGATNTNTVDLGASSEKFKDFYYAGAMTGRTATLTGTESLMLTLNPTANNYGGIWFKYDGTSKGMSVYNSGNMVYGGESGVGTILQTNGQTALTIDTSQNSTFAGNISAGGHVYLTDGNKVILGSGEDFQMYHMAGENTYLRETGEGATVFQSNGWYFQNTASPAVTGVHFTDAGAATFAGDLSLTGGSLSITGDGSNAVTFTETGAGLMTIAAPDDIVLDAEGDITIDANGGDIRLKDAGNTFGFFNSSSDNFYIGAGTQDKDIIFQGNDGGSQINMLTLDSSNGGSATFRDDIDLAGSINMTGSSKVIRLNSGGYIDFDSTNLQFNTQRNPNTGAFNDTNKSHAHIGLQGPDGGSQNCLWNCCC